MTRLYTRLPLFIALSSSLFLFSCQQEPEDTPPPEENPKRLAMHYVLDTAYTSGKDTAWTYRFFYDGQGRLISTLMNEFDAGNPPTDLLYWEEEKRFYNGSETQPFKIVTLSSELPAVQYYDTSFFVYQNGKIIKDSIVRYNTQEFLGTMVSKYVSLDNDRYRLDRFENQPWYPDGYRDTVFSKISTANGNVLSTADTLHDSNGEFWTYKYQFQFDNKPNPEIVRGLPFLFPYLPGNRAMMYHERYNTNNITTVQYDINDYWDGQYNGSSTRVYSYRADGYPLSYVTPGSTEKHVFVYKD